jgi:CRISPR system Cascade subunit CasC
MSKNILNIHVAYTFAGANPNRDDVGAPKTLSYGGVERSRMSSQAMSRAKRVAYELGTHGDLAYRSNNHPVYIARKVIETIQNDPSVTVTDEMRAFALGKAVYLIESLTSNNAESKAFTAAKAAYANLSGIEKTVNPAEEPDQDAESKDSVSLLSKDEFAKVVQIVVEATLETAGTVTSSTFSDKKATIFKGHTTADFVDSKENQSLSIAAYGRMFAAKPELQCEAAVQRSHAFTTHESTIELDPFAVFDDLKGADDLADKGAAHLGTKQLTGGVYYWQATIDRNQLLSNFTKGFYPSNDRLRSFFNTLIDELPKGMSSTTATGQLAPFVLLVEADQGVSLASAFENPITDELGEGYLKPSIEALIEGHNRNESFRPSAFGGTLCGGVYADYADESVEKVDGDGLADYFIEWLKNDA